MTHIIQGIYDRAASAGSYTRHVLIRIAKRTTFDLSVNTFAQMALQRSIFPTLNPLRALVDVTAMWSIQPISEILMLPSSFRSTFMGECLSCGITLSLIGAYRFATDPSYALTDLAALGVTFSPYLLQSGATSFQKFLAQRAKDLLDIQLLEACREGSIVKANKALQKGANPSTKTTEGFSCVSEAFGSGNQEFILHMLEKTQSFNLFWGSILKEIESQQKHFIDNMFTSWGGYNSFSKWNKFEGRHICYLFKTDNIQLFKELWKHIPSNLEVRKNEILKLALRCGSAEISKFLMKEGARVPELELIKNKHKLNINNFLPIFILSTNGLAGFGYQHFRPEFYKEYLNLIHITSEQDLQNLTNIDHLTLLDELRTSKCTLWQTAIYLSLTGEKEDLYEEDQFGLRPLDYAILFDENLGRAFFNFLIKYDKSLITLGTHHTCFHLAILANDSDILLSLLKAINESVFPSRKKSSSIFRDLWKKNVHRELPWVRIELLNRPDAFGLTPLHYSLIRLSLANIDILLKAGAKDIPGSFIQNEGYPISSFLAFTKGFLEKLLNIGEVKFISLTGSEFIQKNKQCYHNFREYAQEKLHDKCLQLLSGEKTYEELTAAR